MQNYFTLHWSRFKRLLTSLELNLYVGIVGIILSFLAISFMIFYKLGLAEYVYSLVAIGAVLPFSFKDRNNVLQNWFNAELFRQVRWVENLLLILPFVGFLLFKGFPYHGLSVAIVAMMMSMIHNISPLARSFGTPYSQKPFEYAIGFRKTIWLVIIQYILLGIALKVGNVNLGLFVLVINIFLAFYYYSLVEPFAFVWNNTREPRAFIHWKLKGASKHYWLTSIPVVVILALFDPSFIWIILGVAVIGWAILTLSIVAKYAHYPRPITLGHTIILTISMIAFPLMLLTIPFFYRKSISNLKSIL